MVRGIFVGHLLDGRVTYLFISPWKGINFSKCSGINFRGGSIERNESKVSTSRVISVWFHNFLPRFHKTRLSRCVTVLFFNTIWLWWSWFQWGKVGRCFALPMSSEEAVLSNNFNYSYGIALYLTGDEYILCCCLQTSKIPILLLRWEISVTEWHHYFQVWGLINWEESVTFHHRNLRCLYFTVPMVGQTTRLHDSCIITSRNDSKSRNTLLLGTCPNNGDLYLAIIVVNADHCSAGYCWGWNYLLLVMKDPAP